MDYPEFYENISRPYRGRPHAIALLNVLDKGLVYFIAAAYICCLAYLAWLALQTGDTRIVRVLAVPAVGFVVCTVLRAALNQPRPYQRYAIDPLIHKDTNGKSMPSRHIFSACIIACALLWMNPVLGIVGFVFCAIVAYCRIAGGVHFPRDVVCAVALALLIGVLGFWVI